MLGFNYSKKGNILGFRWGIIENYNGWGKHYCLDFGKCSGLTNKKPAILAWIKLVIAVIFRKMI